MSLPFQQDRVPPAVICDNAKEMALVEFNRTLKEALYHLKQMEPFTPWLHAANREGKKEPKKVLVGSSLSLALQRDFGMIALNLNPKLGPILHMASTNWMGKSLKPL